jgi:hypothetical protein
VAKGITFDTQFYGFEKGDKQAKVYDYNICGDENRLK